jgi:hypothetical protein
MRALGVETDAEPGQEDFGWYFGYRTVDRRYTLVLGYRPEEPDGDWIGTIERDCGLVASLFGGRARGIAPSAAEAVHAALHGAPELTRVEWHRQADFDRCDETQGAATPGAG